VTFVADLRKSKWYYWTHKWRRFTVEPWWLCTGMNLAIWLHWYTK